MTLVSWALETSKHWPTGRLRLLRPEGLHAKLACLVNCRFGAEPKNLTMTTITIEQAGQYDGQEITLKGWLYNLRESGKLLFPIFRDGTGIIQGVCALQ